MDLHTYVDVLPFVGEANANKLAKLNIYTIKDLLYHLPFRYEDTSQILAIKNIPADTQNLVTIQGKILEIRNIYTRYGKKLTEAVIEDASGIADIIWFNQQYLTKTLPVGQEVMISGKVTFEDFFKPKFISPSYEVLKEGTALHLGKLTAIYPETKGVSSKWLGSRIHYALEKVTIQEWLPVEIRETYNLVDLDKAIHAIHFPESVDEASNGIARIAFDEMLLIQLLMQEKRNIAKNGSAKPIPSDSNTIATYVKSLPFSLTEAQQKATTEILCDLQTNTPMNRLLEGDVGSGKTVVAAAAVYHAYLAGEDVAIMAPTSILAKQHYDTFVNLFSMYGIKEEHVSLVTNKSKPKKESKIFIGTQALLFKQEILDRISLAIVDEQHRFGVHQREKMVNKNGNLIHSLTLTATPIPRTLALSIYGDLDISYLDELPKGRKEILTRIVPEKKRDDMYSFIKTLLDEGRQAFIICPLISLSDKLNVASAKEEFERLKKDIFPNYRLVLLHGQMKVGEKDEILEAFKRHEYDILVSTPVVEVGIDVPNASVMVIEGAERFGLAQLHQLRGRVGRGEYQSYCFLLTSQAEQESIERLQVFSQNTSGLKIAEFDLQNRGPGEVYGVKQSGIPTLKAASLLDVGLITKTKEVAQGILTKGLKRNSSIYKQLEEFKKEIAKLN